MPLSTNQSNIESAVPLLAHTLLPSSVPFPRSKAPGETSGFGPKKDAWNLKQDLENGFHTSSDSVLRYGTIVGFSKLRDGSTGGSDAERIGELPRYLLTKWLCRLPPPTPNSTTRAYIIHPANFGAFSPQKLLASLLATTLRQPPLSRDEAISYLDSVRLFPVFDFSAAAQAIHEVSETMHAGQRRRSRTGSSDPEAGEEEERDVGGESLMIIVVGLDSLAEGVIRASNAVRGAAVLTSALHILTQLSRMQNTCISVLVVNIGGVGPMVHENASLAPRNQRSQGDCATTQIKQEGGIYSMFRTTEAPLFPSLLMRTLERGIDSHILFSNSRVVPVIEVIKDRVGGNLGKWCIWHRGR